MDQKQALVERLKEANNILVTVANNPTVDQLSSCIGLTLALNKMNKHATAVFSGDVPSTIEFLQPEKTIEKNTDSLRDFIIALDKSKADKLRYKVEDKVVKIFITPYRTSITEKDLEFSQGDFNVDAVVAIGVHNQADLDQAITAHGRILHDATVTTVNVIAAGQFGAINWLDTAASSLSELAAELVTDLGADILDEQMATAFLTGIVAETERFSNDKTHPSTMTISAELMAAGANQQLVATKLEPPAPPAPAPAPIAEHEEARQDQPVPIALPPEEPPKPNDGTLEIAHDPGERVRELEAPASDRHEDGQDAVFEGQQPGVEKPEEKEADIAQIHIDDQGSLQIGGTSKPDVFAGQHTGTIDPTKHMGQHIMMEPPSLAGGTNMDDIATNGEERPAGDPIGIAPEPTGILQRSEPFAPMGNPAPLPDVPNDDNPYPSPFSPAAPASIPAPTPAVESTPASPVVVTPTVPQPTPIASTPAGPGQTLSEIEQNVNSPHLQDYSLMPSQQPATLPPVDVNSARDAALQALNAQPGAPAPIQALNSQMLGGPLHGPQAAIPTASPQQGQGPMLPPPGPPPMMP